MQFFKSAVGKVGQWKASIGPWTSVAIVLTLVFGVIIDYKNRESAEQALRADVANRVGILRSNLEGKIKSDVHLVLGLISTLKTEPNMNQARFSNLASQLFKTDTRLRNIAGAPDLSVSLVYPLKGNEGVLGLNYLTNKAQRETVMRVAIEKKVAIAGPIKLVQGGEGIIARFPVSLGNNKRDKFWGILSAVIDTEKLYKAADLTNPEHDFHVALVKKTDDTSKPHTFFGPASILDEEPVVAKVNIPNGSWSIMAVPKSGWNAMTPMLWFQRGAIILSGIILLIPILFAARLHEQSRQHLIQLKRREQILKKLSRMHELALDASKVGVWQYNLVTDELIWDERMIELYDLAKDPKVLCVDDWKNSLHPNDLDRAISEFDHAVETEGAYRSDFRVVLQDGSARHIRANGAVYNDAGQDAVIVGVNWDVTVDTLMQKELEQAKSAMEVRNAELETSRSQIEHMALHDSLTGLANRRQLDDLLAKGVSGDKATSIHALMAIDLDRFKQVNDTFGHAAGDGLLVHVSEILKSLARPEDVVARAGGDEFILVCMSPIGSDELTWMADTIVAQMNKPYVFEGNECRFGVSVGIVQASGNADEDSTMLIKADLALYSAKNQGRNRFEFATEELLDAHNRTKKLHEEIQLGLDRMEFVPHYQPQYSADSLKVVGIEALARWNHPELGILTPDKFLPTAEELNVTAIIDNQIMEHALNDLERLGAKGIKIPKVSVNVSAQRLRDSTLVEKLAMMDVRPGVLTFELVESIFLDDADELIVQNITKLKHLGIEIELDDFGTGHTSIISLLKLSPTRLKIDRQLIMPILESDSARHMAQAIIDIGKSLEIEVVAEGVETHEHCGILREMGADVLQGFGLGRPMSADHLVEHLALNVEDAA